MGPSDLVDAESRCHAPLAGWIWCLARSAPLSPAPVNARRRRAVCSVRELDDDRAQFAQPSGRLCRRVSPAKRSPTPNTPTARSAIVVQRRCSRAPAAMIGRGRPRRRGKPRMFEPTASTPGGAISVAGRRGELRVQLGRISKPLPGTSATGQTRPHLAVRAGPMRGARPPAGRHPYQPEAWPPCLSPVSPPPLRFAFQPPFPRC